MVYGLNGIHSISVLADQIGLDIIDIWIYIIYHLHAILRHAEISS